MKITVYHGGTEVVINPICGFGRKNLDFGQGFYVTNIKEQASKWAIAISTKRQAKALINIYQLDRDTILKKDAAKYLKPTMPNGWNLLLTAEKD